MRLGLTFKILHLSYTQRINERLKQYDLTHAQMDILIFTAIAEKNSRFIHQRDIEKNFKLSNPTVTGLLNRLENKGLIERIENKDDKRIKNIFLTEKGKGLESGIKNIFDTLDQIAIDGFTDEEKDVLEKLLKRVENNLKI